MNNRTEFNSEFYGKTEHYQRLQALKKEYVLDVTIEKYSINRLL